MQQVSDLYRQLLANPWHWKECKAEIAGVAYEQSRIVSMRSSGCTFPKDTLSVGGAISRQIDLVLRWEPGAKPDIPAQAEIRTYVRLTDGTQHSEWLPKGVFYIDTRDEDEELCIVTIHGYDAMLKGETPWEPDQSLEFPMPMDQAVGVLAALLGVDVDSRSMIRSDYMIDYPANDYTIRSVLCYIAAAHAGNFVMTDTGALRLIAVQDAPAETDVERRVSGLIFSPEFAAVAQVVVNVDDEVCYVSGLDTGRTLELTCPYGTQAMADNILASLSGYRYQPFQATEALLDPAAELGDTITVDGRDVIFASMDTTFDDLMTADISAPGGGELVSEYPYKSKIVQEINRKFAQTRSQISKTAEEIRLEVEGVEESVSVAINLLDGLTVTDSEGVVKIKGGMVTADGLHVNAANIDGTLTANQINMTGAITFSDLADDVANDINDAYSMAEDAQGAAASASSLANTAYYNADSALDGLKRLANGQYSGGTFIDGTNIYAPNLYGDTINLLDSYSRVVGTMSLQYSSTYAFDLSSNLSLRLQAAAGYNAYIGNGGASGITCNADGNVNIHGGVTFTNAAFGTSLPTSGTYGQIFFLLQE